MEGDLKICLCCNGLQVPFITYNVLSRWAFKSRKTRNFYIFMIAIFIFLFPGCYLSFPANKLVSGEHCKIVKDESSGLVWLEDMRYSRLNFCTTHIICLFSQWAKLNIIIKNNKLSAAPLSRNKTLRRSWLKRHWELSETCTTRLRMSYWDRGKRKRRRIHFKAPFQSFTFFH